MPANQLKLPPVFGSLNGQFSHEVYALSISAAENNRSLFNFAHIATIVTRRQSISGPGHFGIEG
jgi:hypothetical protein